MVKCHFARTIAPESLSKHKLTENEKMKTKRHREVNKGESVVMEDVSHDKWWY